MIKIDLNRRDHGWAAIIVGDPAYWGLGDPAYWGFGTSICQSVGDLIVSYPGHFGIEIVMPAPPKPEPTNLPTIP